MSIDLIGKLHRTLMARDPRCPQNEEGKNRDAYGITYQSASSILQTLARAGLVKPSTYRKNRRAYAAQAVIDLYG